MADDLQALLDRINEEGVKQADEKSRELLEKASAEAEKTIEEARAEAEKILSDARQEALLLAQKGEQALRQAARDVLLSLRRELEERVRRVAASLSGEALTADLVGEIISSLVPTYLAKGDAEGSLELLLNPEQLSRIEAILRSRLAADLMERCELAPLPDIAAGFRLSFSGADITYDFSDEALATSLAAFLNPKLGSLLMASDDAAE